MKKITTLLLICSLCFFGYRSKALIAQCVVGIVVIGGGIIICLGLKKMCNSIPPLQNPPQPPPPTTNAPAQHVFVLNNTSTTPRLNLSDANVEAYNVSGTVFVNNDPYGNPYTRLFRTTIKSSVDLKQWNTELSLVGWMSTQYVIIVYYNNDGVSVLTNGATLTFGSGTNEVYIPIDTTPPQKFFR